MDVIQRVHNLTDTIDNTVADAKNTVELVVYAVIVAIAACLAMYLFRIYKCFKWCCCGLYNSLCGSSYQEL